MAGVRVSDEYARRFQIIKNNKACITWMLLEEQRNHIRLRPTVSALPRTKKEECSLPLEDGVKPGSAPLQLRRFSTLIYITPHKYHHPHAETS